ncbi:MAG: hypothetical protein WCV67_16305 [Victivallaceae bacterium]|jgi:hypothetical protein
MKKTLSVSTFSKEASEDKEYWRSKTPEERLDALELLRLQSGKFLYEYPARLSRIIEVVKKTPR